MGIIYKITNNVNSKCYIGQTRQTLQHRYKNHLFNAINKNSQFHFHRAIRKYGINNWSTEVIETIDNNLLNEREKYWIKFFDSFKNGYNSTTGGESYVINEEGRKKMSDAYDENRKRKYSEMMKIKSKTHPKMLERYEKMKGAGNHNYGRHLTQDEKDNISYHQKLLKDNEKTKIKKRISKLGENNPNYGKKGCFDHINKSKFKCNVCGLETTKGNISRWHNEKCKMVALK